MKNLILILMVFLMFNYASVYSETKQETSVEKPNEVQQETDKEVKTNVVNPEVKKDEKNTEVNNDHKKDTTLQTTLENQSEKPEYLTYQRAKFVDLEKEADVVKLLQNRNNQQKQIMTELDQKIKEMDQARTDLAKTAEPKKQANKNFQLLVTLYESISAEQAADLLKKLPVSVSVEMMQKMNPKKSSKILAVMDAKIAAEISRRLIQDETSLVSSEVK